MTAAPRRTLVATLSRFGRPHRRALVIGVAGSAGWVACRLAMPWPLRGVVELVFAETGAGHPRGQTVTELLPGVGSPLVWLLGGYVLVIALLAMAELVQRRHLTAFASRTMRDIRAEAVKSVQASGAAVGHGELVVRLVSDVGRVKADLKGILIHASQNGLLFAAICVLFLFLSPFMALFLVVGGALTVWIGFLAGRRVAALAETQREREGQFAASLVDGLVTGEDAAGVKTRETRSGDAGLSRVVTASSLLTHLALALTVAAALAVGVAEARSGALDPGELFLFVAYALMVHRRLIQLGRQLVRVGKLRANLVRIVALIDEGAERLPPTPLTAGIRLDHVVVASPRADRPRLAALDVDIGIGARVAVVGKSGAGKSTLLRLLARLEQPSQGTITWDGQPLAAVSPSSIDYLAQAPHLPSRPVWQILGLDGPEIVPPARLRLLEEVGAWSVVQRLPRGLRQVVSSRTLAGSEVRALCAGRVALGEGPLRVLDAPDEGAGGKEGRRRVAALVERAGPRTVVASFGRLRQADGFTRVIALRRGRVEFDGSPAEWRAWRSAARPSSAAEAS
jgi:ABC-type multidrug transport system fused ATPase/permease subunit